MDRRHNWPIAGAAVVFLAHHVPPSDLVPRIHEVLAKNDDVEQSNNCLCFLVASMKKEDAVFLRLDLERIVNSPTEEAEYELRDQAIEILHDWDDNSASQGTRAKSSCICVSVSLRPHTTDWTHSVKDLCKVLLDLS